VSDTKDKDAKDDGKPSQIIATGRRKRAVARVRLKAGEGKVTINKKRTLETYFTRENDRTVLLTPLKMTSTLGKFDVFITLHGGGATGQAGAARLGISRALVKADQVHYTILKAAGFLTRDAREVERKKPGQAGARRSFQFSKR
jgi:small subunit ribosomal protein S9